MFKSAFRSVLLAAALVCAFPFAAQANEPRHAEYSETHNFGNLADGAGETGTLTAAGVQLGDYCTAISVGVDLQGMMLTCYVSAADTIAYRLQNESGGAVDLASTTVRVLVRRRA